MKEVRLWTVGTISIDDIKTKDAERKGVFGGSLPYASIAASFFQRTGAIGVVGKDFPATFERKWSGFNLDLLGVKKLDGKTFRWSAQYDENMLDRKTVSTEPGVFAKFKPELPETYKGATHVLLGSIDPRLQIAALKQSKSAKFVCMDTIDCWIREQPEALREAIKLVTMLTINDAEARLLTGKWNLVEAATQLLKMGPRYILVKKGEHGALLFTEDDIFICPAYPLRRVLDPTGAGDAFAGAFMGFLAHADDIKDRIIHSALLHAASVASFCVEEFGVERLTRLTLSDIKSRVSDLKHMTKV